MGMLNILKDNDRRVSLKLAIEASNFVTKDIAKLKILDVIGSQNFDPYKNYQAVYNSQAGLVQLPQEVVLATLEGKRIEPNFGLVNLRNWGLVVDSRASSGCGRGVVPSGGFLARCSPWQSLWSKSPGKREHLPRTRVLSGAQALSTRAVAGESIVRVSAGSQIKSFANGKPDRER